MQKRVFIIHGWGGYPDEAWFPWMRAQLEQRDVVVHAPSMPDTDQPRIDAWIPALAAAVGTPDADTYFVGHSMGCQAMVRYLATLPLDAQIGGAVFVGGFISQLSGLETDNERAVADAWLSAPIDFPGVARRLPRSVAIFSDNDPFVPLSNQDDFRDKLGSEIILVHGMGHFNESDGARVMELPVALDALVRMMGVV